MFHFLFNSSPPLQICPKCNPKHSSLICWFPMRTVLHHDPPPCVHMHEAGPITGLVVHAHLCTSSWVVQNYGHCRGTSCQARSDCAGSLWVSCCQTKYSTSWTSLPLVLPISLTQILTSISQHVPKTPTSDNSLAILCLDSYLFCFKRFLSNCSIQLFFLRMLTDTCRSATLQLSSSFCGGFIFSLKHENLAES